jgi:hypothetical protein
MIPHTLLPKRSIICLCSEPPSIITLLKPPHENRQEKWISSQKGIHTHTMHLGLPAPLIHYFLQEVIHLIIPTFQECFWLPRRNIAALALCEIVLLAHRRMSGQFL